MARSALSNNVEKPLVFINGEYIEQFFSFRQSSTYRQFQDTIEITLGGLGGLANQIKIGDEVQTTIGGETNTFLISELQDGGGDQSAVEIKLSGNSIDYLEGLDDAEPKKYIDTTDNAIITELLGGGDFDEATGIQELNVNPNERKKDVAIRAAKQAGFLLYVTGGVLYKKEVSTENNPVKTFIDDTTSREGITGGVTVMLRSLRRSISTTHVKSKVLGYSIDKDYKNIQAEQDVPTNLIFAKGEVKTNNVEYIKINAQDPSEIDRTLTGNTRKAAPKETVQFTVKGRDDIQVNQVADLKFQRYEINAPGVCYQKDYNVAKNGEMTTTLFFHPLGRSY